MNCLSEILHDRCRERFQQVYYLHYIMSEKIYFCKKIKIEAESPRVINMERIIKKLRRKEAAAKH